MYPTLEFLLIAPLEPAGDQPEAIRALIDGLQKGRPEQVLRTVRLAEK